MQYFPQVHFVVAAYFMLGGDLGRWSEILCWWTLP